MDIEKGITDSSRSAAASTTSNAGPRRSFMVVDLSKLGTPSFFTNANEVQSIIFFIRTLDLKSTPREYRMTTDALRDVICDLMELKKLIEDIDINVSLEKKLEVLKLLSSYKPYKASLSTRQSEAIKERDGVIIDLINRTVVNKLYELIESFPDTLQSTENLNQNYKNFDNFKATLIALIDLSQDHGSKDLKNLRIKKINNMFNNLPNNRFVKQLLNDLKTSDKDVIKLKDATLTKLNRFPGIFF